MKVAIGCDHGGLDLKETIKTLLADRDIEFKDLGTGKSQQVTITGGTALGQDDIDQMIKDAEAHADEDKKARELVDTKNTAENMIHATEKSIALSRSWRGACHGLGVGQACGRQCSAASS